MFDHLLCPTGLLLNHIFHFTQDFNIPPSKKHIGTAIQFSDLLERQEDFLQELVVTVNNWVFNKAQVRRIVDERLKLNNDNLGDASAFLTRQAHSKFRPGHPQGQFGELILFNFLQHFFKAVPLLRKQNITTNPNLERFGADAIHFKREGQDNIFYLGESKCYKSESQFNVAFKNSIESIITSYTNFSSEMSLYTYDDFIEPELEIIAKDFKSGILQNTRFELVCLIAYSETRDRIGENQQGILNKIKEAINYRCKKFNQDIFTNIDTPILNRINYIIFPFWDFDLTLTKFQRLTGTIR